MAIAVIGFTVVVPLSSVERGYPGGLLAWVERWHDAIGTGVWFDDKLAGIAYFDPESSYEAVCEWRKLGFMSRLGDVSPDSALLCTQVDEELGVLGKDVDWLEFDPYIPEAWHTSTVWHKGSEPGLVAIPERTKQDREAKAMKAGGVEAWLKRWGKLP